MGAACPWCSSLSGRGAPRPRFGFAVALASETVTGHSQVSVGPCGLSHPPHSNTDRQRPRPPPPSSTVPQPRDSQKLTAMKRTTRSQGRVRPKTCRQALVTWDMRMAPGAGWRSAGGMAASAQPQHPRARPKWMPEAHPAHTWSQSCASGREPLGQPTSHFCRPQSEALSQTLPTAGLSLLSFCHRQPSRGARPRAGPLDRVRGGVAQSAAGRVTRRQRAPVSCQRWWRSREQGPRELVQTSPSGSVELPPGHAAPCHRA